MSYVDKIRNRILNKGNSYGEDLIFHDDGEIHEVILHRGCTSRFREDELIDSISSCLKKIEIDFSVLSDETCCGIMMFLLGDNDTGKTIVNQNIEKFNHHGVKKIITICPGCYESFTKYYTKHPDFNIDVVFAMDLFKDLSIDGTGYIIHDPCHALERSETARSIIKNVPKSRANFCCGFSIAVETGNKEKAREVSEKTLSKGNIITYCPSCYHTLNNVDSDKTTDFYSFIDKNI